MSLMVPDNRENRENMVGLSPPAESHLLRRRRSLALQNTENCKGVLELQNMENYEGVLALQNTENCEGVLATQPILIPPSKC